MIETINVPADDRFQIFHEHPPDVLRQVTEPPDRAVVKFGLSRSVSE